MRPDVLKNSGERDEQALRSELARIPSSVEKFGSEYVLDGDRQNRVDGIRGHRQEQRILATSTGLGFDRYDMVEPEDVDKFVKKFPTPVDFEERSAEFLGMIRQNNPEAKYLEYLRSMDSFQRKVYGDQYERYLEYREEVNSSQSERSNRRERSNRIESRGFAQKVKNLFGRSERESGVPKSIEEADGETIYELSQPEVKKMMKKAVMSGDSLYDENGREMTVSIEDLRTAELEPKYGMTLEGVKFGFSEIFKVEDRDATIGYVNMGDKTYVRSYYRSNSQGAWRYLPDREQMRNGDVIWYGKGQSQEAITLPSEIQAFLNKCEINDRDTKIRDDDLTRKRHWGFLGTAKAIKYTGKEYYEARRDGRINDDLSREVSSEARFVYINHKLPEQMYLNKDLSPDFSKEISKYSAFSGQYGDYEARVYESDKGDLKWTIMEDKQGRAWVGQVEVQSRITSTGLRSDWVKAGDFATPLYEYPGEDGGYGDYTQMRGGYVSMWKNYLSKIPMIREYRASRARQMSDQSERKRLGA